MYAHAFLDHFQRPRGQGALDRPTHRGEGQDPACGDRLWLDLRVEGGIVAEARYRVQGCAGAIAVGSALLTLLPGRPASPRAVSPAEIEALLGAVPRAKRHALGLALRTLEAALRGAPAGGT